MKNFIKSKFFTVIVIITLIMVIVPSVFGVMGVGKFLRNGVNVILTPLQRVFTSVTDACDGFISYFTEFDRVVEENKALHGEINALKDRISSAEETEKINEWLFEYLELKREHTDYTMLDATITGREGSNYLTVFTLNRGTAHGVSEGMPVVVSEGIVGYITEAGTDWSKAVTFLESGSAVGAYVERSGAIGVVEGDYLLAKDGLCEMKYLPADADIKVGDRIITGGYGSIYPRGLVVGYVEEVKDNDASRSIDVTVRASADLADISRVMVVTAYDAYTEK